MKLRIRKTFRRKHQNTRGKTRHQKGGNTLDIFYGAQLVVGQKFPKSITQSEPSIRFPTTGQLYTLVMWDSDVPYEFQPGWAHWIVTNIKSPNDIKNNQLLEYKGPSPPSGTHRYYFGLFEQSKRIYLRQPNREKFNINSFVDENNLTKIAQIYMKVSAT